MGGSAADVENAALRTTFDQPPVKIPIQQTQRLLPRPHVAMYNLALVQTGRDRWHFKLAIKRL
jgi:hypothetical protein